MSRSGPSNFPDTSLFSLHFQRLRRLRVYHPAPVRSHDPFWRCARCQDAGIEGAIDLLERATSASRSRASAKTRPACPYQNARNDSGSALQCGQPVALNASNAVAHCSSRSTGGPWPQTVGHLAHSDDVGRAFRLMSATCSDRSRPAVPIDVGRGGGAPAGRV